MNIKFFPVFLLCGLLYSATGFSQDIKMASRILPRDTLFTHEGIINTFDFSFLTGPIKDTSLNRRILNRSTFTLDQLETLGVITRKKLR